MIIYNEDRIKSDFIAKDHVLFEINSPMPLKQILNTLLKGEELPDNTIINIYEDLAGGYSENEYFEEQSLKFIYNNDSNYAIPVLEDINERPVTPHNYNVFFEDYDEDYDDWYVGRRIVPETDKQKQAFYRKYEAVAIGNATSSCRKIEERDIKSLINELSCSLNILPNLFEKYPNMSIKDAQNLTNRAKHIIELDLLNNFPDEPRILSIAGLLDKNMLDILKDLTDAEMRLINNSVFISNYSPFLRIAYNKRLLGKDAIAPVNVLEYPYHNYISNEDNLGLFQEDIDKLTKLFEDKFKRAPKVTNLLLLTHFLYHKSEQGYSVNHNNYTYNREQILKDFPLEEIVESFDLKNISKIAKYKSPTLFMLATPIDGEYVNFNTLKDDQIEALAACLSPLIINSTNKKALIQLINNNIKEITPAFLLKLSKVINGELFPALWDGSLFHSTPKEIETRIELEKELKEQQKWEGAGIDITKNELFLKGTDIVVENDKHRMYFLDPQDLRNMTSGIYTSCCQRFGDCGRSCVETILTRPNSGNVIIEDKRTGNILAQGWVWGNDKTLVFDNVEFDPRFDNKVRFFNDIFTAFAKESPFENIHVGVGYNPGMTGWGKKIEDNEFLDKDIVARDFDLTTDSYLYSDYHPNNARVIKRDGEVLLKSTLSYETKEVENIYKERQEFLVESANKVLAEQKEKLKEFDMLGVCNIDTALRLIDTATNNPNEILPYDISYMSGKLVDIFIDNVGQENLTEDMHQAIYSTKGSSFYFDHISTPLPVLYYSSILANPTKIRTIPNPPEELCIEVVKLNGLFVKFINPDFLTNDIVRQAIFTTPNAINSVPAEFITPEIINICIENDPKSAILVFNKLNDNQICEIVENKPSLIEIVPSFARTPELCETAVNKDPFVINKLPFDRNLVNLAIHKEPKLIKNYEFKCPQLIDDAIRLNPSVVTTLRKPKEEHFLTALEYADDSQIGKIRQSAIKHGFNLNVREPEIQTENLALEI